jgi:hypothetical protein
VNALRRTLSLQAAIWGIAGVALALAPHFVLASVFGQPAPNEPAWIRLVGIQAVTVAMLMVLVARRIGDLWWWSWAFALMNTAVAVLVLLNAAFGLDAGESSLLWWLFTAVAVGFDLALLYGLFVASRQNPLP